MAPAKKSAPSTKSKKVRDEDDDEDPPAKTRKGKAVVDEDDDEEEEEEDDDTEDADTDDDDDDDAETSDDDDDDEEESDDDDESEDDSDDDTDKSTKEFAPGGFSWDPEDATGGGLPEGRVVLLNPRTRLGDRGDYKQDDPEGIPLFSLDAVPIDKKGTVGEPWDGGIHLTAGSAERIVPTADGTDFEPAEGSKVRGLAKSSNTYLFVKSAQDAGLTRKSLLKRGMLAFDGMEVTITRVPQPKRSGMAAASEDEEGGFEKTYPHISEIHSFPWDAKGEERRNAARAKVKGKKKSKGKTAGKHAKVAKSPKAPAAKVVKESAPAKRKASSDSDIIEAAETAIQFALASDKYAKRGLPKDDIYPAAFQQVKSHPERKAIMKLIEIPDFYTDDARPWFYDDKLDRITKVG